MMIKTFQLVFLLLTYSQLFPNKYPADMLLPEPRSGYSLSYDLREDIVVLFGGQDSLDSYLGDTWSWSKQEGWNKINVEGPSPRINSAMSYHVDLGGIILFGGLTKDGPTNDLWLFKDSKWVQIQTDKNPPSRQLGTLAYNDYENRVILFGGKNSEGNRLDDSWAFNGKKWTILSRGPSARSSHTSTYYPKNKSILVFGGYDGEVLGDVWELKGRIWKKNEMMNGPKRIHSSIIYDSDKNRLLLFGGFAATGRTNEVWAFSGIDWTSIGTNTPLAARAEHESVYIPGLGMFVFGGVIGEDPRKRVRANDTWIYSNEWENMNSN